MKDGGINIKDRGDCGYHERLESKIPSQLTEHRGALALTWGARRHTRITSTVPALIPQLRFVFKGLCLPSTLNA